jgi:tetratricopeptide (TPR) repeat protein
MANKAKKPAPKGPMAVNKSETPGWMRIVIIAVVISFAVGGVAIVAAGISGGGGGTSNTGSGDSITAQYQPRVQSAKDVLATDPQNPDRIAEVGHAYFEWAVALYEAGQQPASVPVWRSAVDSYDQALAIRPDDDVVLGNKAFALYYAGDREPAIPALRAFIDAASDNTRLSAQVENARGMLAELEAAPSAPATTTP